MPITLHSISPFVRTNPKQCSTFSLPRKKPSFSTFASPHKTTSRNTPTFRLRKWKEGTKFFKNKLIVAFLHIERMVKMGHTPDPFEAQELLFDLCREGMLLKSVRVFEFILESNTEPDQFTRTFIIDTLANIGAYEYAIKLLDKILERGLTLEHNAYSALTISLCKQSYTRKSCHHLEKLINKDLIPCNQFDFAAIIEALDCEKGVDEAMAIMHQILKKGRPKAHIVCYNVILSALCRDNRVSDAIKLFGAIPLAVRPNLVSYNILLSGLCSEDRWRDAEILLSEIITEKRTYPNNITYIGLIKVLANKGYPEEALRIAELLVKSGFETNAWCFNPIIEQFCFEKKVDMVHKVLNIMEEINIDVNEGTYIAICVLCTKGNVDAAFNILQTISLKKKVSLNAFYSKVIHYLCRKGSSLEAIQILNKLAQLGFTPNTAIVSALANGLCMLGNLEEAMEMFELMEKKGIRSDVLNYNTLILGLCKMVRVDLALKVLERMILRGYDPNENSYFYILEGMAYQDRRDLTKELLRELALRNLVRQSTVEKLTLMFCLEDV